MIISCEPAFAEREIEDVAYRRRPTPMLIVDRRLRIIAHSSQLNVAGLAGRIRQLVRRHIAECESCVHATVEILDADTALRVVDLAGEDGGLFCNHGRTPRK